MADRPASPRARLACVIHGHVQGVGFRWFVREQARRLGIDGTVHNREDGAVEVHAAAPETTLARLRELLAKGPPGAEVTHVDEVMPSLQELPTPFRILR
jgi:acylphosphatase